MRLENGLEPIIACRQSCLLCPYLTGGYRRFLVISTYPNLLFYLFVYFYRYILQII